MRSTTGPGIDRASGGGRRNSTLCQRGLDCPEQTEVDKGVQPDFPFTMETRQGKRGKSKKKYNPYGKDFVLDRIVLSDMMDLLVGLDEVVVPQEIDLVNDTEEDWIDDCYEPEWSSNRRPSRYMSKN